MFCLTYSYMYINVTDLPSMPPAIIVTPSFISSSEQRPTVEGI